MTDSPNIVVIAGPNGAGKSTTAPALLAGVLGVIEFVNADVIAQGLSAFNPEGAAMQAGRVMLRRLKELAASRASFAFETTLASKSFAPWIERIPSDLPLPSFSRIGDRARRQSRACGRPPRFV
jgi:predicted ABC-type ATPase